MKVIIAEKMHYIWIQCKSSTIDRRHDVYAIFDICVRALESFQPIAAARQVDQIRLADTFGERNNGFEIAAMDV
jgi:hypothetical protein